MFTRRFLQHQTSAAFLSGFENKFYTFHMGNISNEFLSVFYKAGSKGTEALG